MHTYSCSWGHCATLHICAGTHNGSCVYACIHTVYMEMIFHKRTFRLAHAPFLFLSPEDTHSHTHTHTLTIIGPPERGLRHHLEPVLHGHGRLLHARVREAMAHIRMRLLHQHKHRRLAHSRCFGQLAETHRVPFATTGMSMVVGHRVHVSYRCTLTLIWRLWCHAHPHAHVPSSSHCCHVLRLVHTPCVCVCVCVHTYDVSLCKFIICKHTVCMCRRIHTHKYLLDTHTHTETHGCTFDGVTVCVCRILCGWQSRAECRPLLRHARIMMVVIVGCRARFRPWRCG